MASSNDALKRSVLARVAPGAEWRVSGQTSYVSAAGRVHARYKSRGPYSFNINPATLKADYELWICGASDTYYLLPIAVVKSMYEHPDAYVDAHHPEIRVVSIDTASHRATYAAGGQSLDLTTCYQADLPPFSWTRG